MSWAGETGGMFGHLAGGRIGGFFRLTPEEREAALELTRAAWGDDESWSALPEHAQIFAALTLPMVRPFDRVLDTVKCLNCRDSGFQAGRVYGAWFCSMCDKGLLLEAGHWRRVRFPQVRGRRVASVDGMREFEAYSKHKPQRAEKVKTAIASLVQRERQEDVDAR